MTRVADATDQVVAESLDRLASGLNGLLAAGPCPTDSADAIRLIEQLEQLGRRLDAARIDLVDQIDRRGLHRVDGHHSAKAMARHVAQLSGAEAAARARAARALRDLPDTRAAFRAGQITGVRLLRHRRDQLGAAGRRRRHLRRQPGQP